MMWNARWLWIQWRGNVLHLDLIWGTPINFAFLRWHQCSSLDVTVVLGILFSSIREIEVPYVFDWEHGTLQHEMKGNRATSCSEGEVSWDYSSCGRHLVYILELRRGWPYESRVCSAQSGLLSSYDGQLGILNMLGTKIQRLLEMSREAKSPLLVGTVILYSYQFSRRVRHRHLLKHWTQRTSRSLKWMWGPLSRRGWELSLSLGSPQGIQTCLHLVIWKMSLHLRHCRESRPSFESGHRGVHYTWGRKHRVSLTYLFLREGSSWDACGKLAYLFSRRQKIILIPRRYAVHGIFLKLL